MSIGLLDLGHRFTMWQPLIEDTIIAIISRMISNTKFIIVGGDNNNDDDNGDELLLITGSDKYADVFATIFTEQLMK